MPRDVFNWTFADIDKFLKDHSFKIAKSNSSHFFYRGISAGKLCIVCVPFHGGNKTIKPKTLKGIISQSGISKEEWVA
ncbi:MAG: type II toxin-antitoxin system HicA family toxin [Patescibacteria group bacterium]